MAIKVYLDWSNICHISYSIAVKRFNSEPPRYDLLDMFYYNLETKLRTLSTTIRSRGFLDFEFIFVKDESSIRKILRYPNYKVHRSGNDVPMDDASQFVKNEGHGRVCHSPANEADDAIASLVKETGGIIISGDKDLWQLLSPNVLILNPLTLSFISTPDIEKAFSLSVPAHIALYKTLWGDYGDGVPNAVPYMQKQLLPIIRVTDGSLDMLRAEIKSAWWGLTRKCRDRYAENEKQVLINWELVKLTEDCAIVWD